MEDNRNELMNVEETELVETEYEDEEYEEESAGGISLGTLFVGLGLGALGAIGVRKGIGWWRNRKAQKEVPYVELDPDDEGEFEDPEEELEED